MIAKDRRVKIPILIFAAASASPSLAAHQTATSCLAGKRTALVRGHFSGEIFCSRKNASFVLVGRTTGKNYAIYDYRYSFLPHAEGVVHGGRRLVVFHGETYLGQYGLSPPEVEVHIVGSQVLLTTPHRRETVPLDFSKRPPAKILVNGELENFSR